MKATMNERIKTNLELSNLLILHNEAKPLYNRCCVNEVVNGYCSDAFKTCLYLHKNCFLLYYKTIFENLNVPILDDSEYLTLCKKLSNTEDANEKKILKRRVQKLAEELYKKQDCIYWTDPKGMSKRQEFGPVIHRFCGSIFYYKNWPTN